LRHLRVALVSGERLRALIGGQPPRSRRATVALVEGKGRARHGVGVAPPSALGVGGNLVAHRATGAMLRAARVPIAPPVAVIGAGHAALLLVEAAAVGTPGHVARVLVAPPLALEVALGRDGLRGIPRRHADGVIRLGANGRDNGRAEAGKTCSPECPCLLELRARELADLLPRGVRVRINDVFVVRIISRVWPRRCIGPVPAAGASHYLLEDAVIVVHAVSVRVRALVCVGQAARGAADIANEGRLRVARRAEPGLVAAHECGARGTEHSRGGVFIVACLRALEGKQQEEGQF